MNNSKPDDWLNIFIQYDHAVNTTLIQYLLFVLDKTSDRNERHDDTVPRYPFPKLLSEAQRLSNDSIPRATIEVIGDCHRIRNDISHNYVGLTVERWLLLDYAHGATMLFRSLFGDGWFADSAATAASTSAVSSHESNNLPKSVRDQALTNDWVELAEFKRVLTRELEWVYRISSMYAKPLMSADTPNIALQLAQAGVIREHFVFELKSVEACNDVNAITPDEAKSAIRTAMRLITELQRTRDLVSQLRNFTYQDESLWFEMQDIEMAISDMEKADEDDPLIKDRLRISRDQRSYLNARHKEITQDIAYCDQQLSALVYGDEYTPDS